jgi:hypothetical protein
MRGMETGLPRKPCAGESSLLAGESPMGGGEVGRNTVQPSMHRSVPCIAAPRRWDAQAARALGAAKTAIASSHARHVPERTLLCALAQAHYPDFIARLEKEDRTLPAYAREEFEAFLRCGVLGHGLLRVVWEQYQAERLVAFSCKKRGFCPSSGARRMAERARHLVEEAFGPRPVPQSSAPSSATSRKMARGASALPVASARSARGGRVRPPATESVLSAVEGPRAKTRRRHDPGASRRAALGPLPGIGEKRKRTESLRSPAMSKPEVRTSDPRPKRRLLDRPLPARLPEKGV